MNLLVLTFSIIFQQKVEMAQLAICLGINIYALILAFCL